MTVRTRSATRRVAPAPPAIKARHGPWRFAAVADDAYGFWPGGYGSFGPLRLGVEHVRLDAGEESTPAGLFARVEKTRSCFR